jgi:hypothetical protein
MSPGKIEIEKNRDRRRHQRTAKPRRHKRNLTTGAKDFCVQAQGYKF